MSFNVDAAKKMRGAEIFMLAHDNAFMQMAH